jgi:predicted CoA-binding protein
MKEFLSEGNTVAVVGVSASPEKWGHRVYRALRSFYRNVYAVNPKHGSVAGGRCYPDLRSLPERPGMVVTVVPPHATEETVRMCRQLGIRKVWMQPGSESREAIDYCSRNGIKEVHGCCLVLDGLKGGWKNETRIS